MKKEVEHLIHLKVIKPYKIRREGSFVSVVLAYYYSQSKEIKIVLIYENKTNKKVGSYDAVNGLDLN